MTLNLAIFMQELRPREKKMTHIWECVSAYSYNIQLCRSQYGAALEASGPSLGLCIIKGCRASHGHALHVWAVPTCKLFQLGNSMWFPERGWSNWGTWVSCKKGAVVAHGDCSIHHSTGSQRAASGSGSKCCAHRTELRPWKQAGLFHTAFWDQPLAQTSPTYWLFLGLFWKLYQEHTDVDYDTQPQGSVEACTRPSGRDGPTILTLTANSEPFCFLALLLTFPLSFQTGS